MKKTALFVFLALLFYSALAQDSDLHREILNTENTTVALITKGRMLLAKKFTEGDYAKMREIEQYLSTNLSNSDYVVLYPMEQWLIAYWTQNYQNLITDIKQYETIRNSYSNKIELPDDHLYELLNNKTLSNRDLLIEQINAARLTNTEKEFLVIHLYEMLLPVNNNVNAQDTINQMADKYLQSEQDTTLINFTRKYIRRKYVPSNWGYGFEIFSGYGTFNNNLAKTFNNNVPIGVAFDISYKNFNLFLRDYIGFTKTKTELYSNDGSMLKSQSPIEVYLPEISLGYNMIDNKYVKLAPFAGISSIDIGPPTQDQNKEKELKKFNLDFTTTYSFGMNLDIKIAQANSGQQSVPMEVGYWFLRIRYSYNKTQLYKHYPDTNGDMQYLTIGIGGFGRKVKRDY